MTEIVNQYKPGGEEPMDGYCCNCHRYRPVIGATGCCAYCYVHLTICPYPLPQGCVYEKP